MKGLFIVAVWQSGLFYASGIEEIDTLLQSGSKKAWLSATTTTNQTIEDSDVVGMDIEAIMSNEGILNEDGTFNIESYGSVRTRNKKQKEWAAEAFANFEVKVCTRGKSSEVWQLSQGVDLATPGMCYNDANGFFKNKCTRDVHKRFGRTKWRASGSFRFGDVCCKPCVSPYPDFDSLQFRCVNNDAPCTDDWVLGSRDYCRSPCTVAHGLPHLKHKCGEYCAKNRYHCEEQITSIAFAFVDVISNLIPGKAVFSATKTVLKGSKVAGDLAWRAAQKLLISVCKKKAKEMVKEMGETMIEYMEGVPEPLAMAILEDGAEQLLIKGQAEKWKKTKDLLAGMATELLLALDPTGLSGLVESFKATSCEKSKIQAMPSEGLDLEAVRGDLEDIVDEMGDKDFRDNIRASRRRVSRRRK